jgi:hypothetical protein
MYTNLPHEAIVASLVWLLALFKSQSGRFGVWISKDEVGFHKMDPSAVFFSCDTLLLIACFDIHHAIFLLGSIRLLQMLGIPMGSPISPQLAIIICAHSEHSWSIPRPLWRARLAASRFMDDTSMIVAFRSSSQSSFDEAMRILSSIIHHCYPSQLTLKHVLSLISTTLMRCDFFITDHTLQYAYVNKNASIISTNLQTFYRYRQYRSFCPRATLINTAIATLRSIELFSSNPDRAYGPGLMLLIELHSLDYPWIFIKGIAKQLKTNYNSELGARLSAFCDRCL